MKKLVRKGECNNCGLCCGDCIHLDKSTYPDKSYCKIYPTRPDVCRRYPNHPRCISQHFECSIKFYDAETSKEITKKPFADWKELDSYVPVEEDC